MTKITFKKHRDKNIETFENICNIAVTLTSVQLFNSKWDYLHLLYTKLRNYTCIYQFDQSINQILIFYA